MQHKIKINRTAHYYTIGENNTDVKTIWFVLHGYGYLAKYFIKKFNPIANNENLIVAPEGLSKLYLNGVGYDGKIGASWMTADNRADEIEDYVNYLNQLYQTIVVDFPDAKINILGFSQGGATASRWIADGRIKCDNFILWASVFPDEMNFKSISNINTYFLYGDNDEYVTEERVAKQKKIITTSGIQIKSIAFEGKHDIPEKVLVEQTEINGWG